KLAAEEIKGKYNLFFWLYDDKIRQKLLDEQFITDCMQTALEQEQFQVYYQAKYNLSNERIAGAEALVRWIHPTKGFLSPGEFIPLFEKNGFIIRLDQYVWEQVCKNLHDWIAAGNAPVAVSVNVSRADIYNPGLTGILQGLIEKYEIPIQYLHLEITETAYTDDPSQILKVVEELHDMGFIIELDDFGSGYSSLNMLAEMPIDILKLDMRFIQVEDEKATGKGILSFIISLAKWLNLAVVAEGVETEKQVASLRTMDCNYVQGFYYAKPLPRQDFEALLHCTCTTDMLCTAAPPLPAAPPAPGDPEKQNHIMLVVDDVEINARVLAGFFENEYTVVIKEDGNRAWEYLCENSGRVEIIMLDLLMPVMDGFQLLSRIRTDKRTKGLPVIITSQGNKNSEQRALAMGADDFISKPYNREIVQHRTRNVTAHYKVKQLEEKYNAALLARQVGVLENIPDEPLQQEMNRLRRYFDVVRLVDPAKTRVLSNCAEADCELHSCYSVWGKPQRCNNCISLRAARQKATLNKLEYSSSGLYFVISQYVSRNGQEGVLELVVKLDDAYVDNIFDRDLLYMKLETLNREIETDELTGLYNRRHIDRTLAQYLAQAQSAGRSMQLAMIDIDGLKQINDTYGHLFGDAAIKKIADVLRAEMSMAEGDFIARYGGDEFLVVRRNVEKAAFANQLRRATQTVAAAQLADNPAIALGISVGCVGIQEIPGCDTTALLQKADERMYRAKMQGRGCLVTEDEKK
ncbi:MAG: EAL domain-containing protein, partial [Gemmiger sp.]|nr:EAL domain-containing protein [Gemmiger sp.]